MDKIMSKKATEKVAPKKVFKISILFYSDDTARIIRKDLPALIDKTEKSVEWLETHDFKEEDIEIIGDKPDCWKTYYPTPVSAPVVEPIPLVEKITDVLDAPIVI
jgi:hypothetical protein